MLSWSSAFPLLSSPSFQLLLTPFRSQDHGAARFLYTVSTSSIRQTASRGYLSPLRRRKAISRLSYSPAILSWPMLTCAWSSRIDLWPKQFNVYLTRQSCRLSDIQAWLRTHGTPLCMFMPDRHGSGPASQSNDASFRQLARTMMDNQVVSTVCYCTGVSVRLTRVTPQICVAPWNDPNRPVGSGILLLPTTSSTGLLVGAIFLDEPFPDFIFNDASHPATAIPAGLPSAYPYPQAFPASASGVSPSSVSPAQRAMSPGPQRFYQAQYDYSAYQYASKPPPNRPFSPLPLSRQPQSDPAFNWPYIEDTSDGSGHTSPGTTHSRP